jgi:hypothetical protein
MSHLSVEDLARLVDEPPTPAETAHLETCEACRHELEELQADAAMLGALPDLAPPRYAWPALEARLAAEGLIARRHDAPTRGATLLLRTAAGIVLFALGTGVGAFALAPRIADPAPSLAGVPSSPTQDVPRPSAPREDASTRLVAGDAANADTSPHTPDSLQLPRPSLEPRRAANAAPSPRTAEEALAWMRQAEADYLEALSSYADLAGAFDGDPTARLAALEGIVLTTRAALGEAPADPVINGYHLTALAHRETALRQIAAATTQSWF